MSALTWELHYAINPLLAYEYVRMFHFGSSWAIVAQDSVYLCVLVLVYTDVSLRKSMYSYPCILYTNVYVSVTGVYLCTSV